MIRLFAALHVPDLIAEGLMRRQTGLKGANWRPREALHITLRFFGQVAEPVADDIDSALSVVGGPPLTLTLAKVGSFDDGKHVEAVWAGVEPDPALEQLAARCESAARRAGLKAETRTYKPHVTLAYLRRPDPARVAGWIADHNLLHSPPFPVTGFGLYSSWLSKEGSRYELERDYPLGA